ncbi:glycerophosphoryl diester phosphodiesterase membrane domain-containing protein [Bacillus sp. PS06]|uniref:glycerophosphoryl diester phosphodiesterase membrane domain-containing protein n=1 Tax=Bacillus sp. PS06 TaxID=2764176 RepID=UPI0017842D57|nr:glycerophosphoryl diester phosphodiesterase membrane domain-containing protein [Bacillus sp. PS06]MBD8067683.1 glycerophosphoryl diester phosphodiesterase membrane domain-containing protein [Bacillus sp. PS06]
MNTEVTTSKAIGEILDQTFRLSKNHFKHLFLIMLIFGGPLYIIQAIVQLATGTSFFRQVGGGDAWYEQIISSFDESTYIETPTNLGADLGLILIGLLTIIFLPVAQAGIMIAINHIRKNEQYTIGQVLKHAFSRFWPILGSSILFGLIVFGLVIVPLIAIGIGSFIISAINPILAVLIGILLFIGGAVGIGFLVTRWSFYFGSVVLDRESPGLSRSWKLTTGRTWKLMAVYIIIYLIISSIGVAVELTLGMALGNSVLFTIIVNLVSLFTSVIFAVGYTVMYLDLKTRHDGDDLKDLIEEYNDVK